MAPRLSKNKVGSNCAGIRSYDNNDFTYCSLIITAAMARYLTSVEERATVCCFVDF